jgi:thiamine-phosphate pyrophosphorylase
VASLPFSVLLITDEDACHRASRGVVETVARALEHDASHVAVLVRDKRREPIDLCRALLPIVRRARAKILVHTHAHLVARLGLDGAHIASDADPREARIALPRGALLGMSRHEGDQIDVGVDYAMLAPIFSPTSKPHDRREPIGIEGLRDACARAQTPIVALGGINDARAPQCFHAGAHAVAVIGHVMESRHPRRALLSLT